MKQRNTFGNYKFDNWVCEKARKAIKDFWGCFGRTYKDWQNSAKSYKKQFPKHGEFVYISKRNGKSIVSGKFLYLWNNMAILIDNEKTYSVSTCNTFYKKYDL